MDESSLIVLDKDDNRKYDVTLIGTTDTSATLRIPRSDVGDVPNGESRTYTVKFNTEGLTARAFPWTYFIFFSMIVMLFAIIFVLVAKKQDRSLLVLTTIIIGSIITVIAIIPFSLGL